MYILRLGAAEYLFSTGIRLGVLKHASNEVKPAMLQIFFLKKWIITLKYYSIFSLVWPKMITELYNMKNAHLINYAITAKNCRLVFSDALQF